MIESHGSYIEDLRATLKSVDITPGEAVGLIETHVDEKRMALHLSRHGRLNIDDPNLMINKTWLALYLTETGQVVCMGKANSGYRLYYIRQEAIIEQARKDNEMLRIESVLGQWCRSKGIREYIEEDRLYRKKSDPGELIQALLRTRQH